MNLMPGIRKLNVQITEIDKGDTPLTLHNFRDELVNNMYKKTIADSSRTEMRFYVTVFFLCFKMGSKSLLRKLFEDNLTKLEALNAEFSKRPKLQKNEYADLVNQVGLTQIFKRDIPFLLISTILDSKNVLKEFHVFFEKNPDLKKEFVGISEKYSAKLEDFYENFRSHRIEDDRYDDFGNYHDLSKSVFRTIKMRTSRQLDLTLHKYAEIKEVKSHSPIDLTVLQQLDPYILFNLWEAYDIGHYVGATWDYAAEAAGITAGIDLLLKKWTKWKSINGRTDRKKKNAARKSFELEIKKKKYVTQFSVLIEVLAKSVLNADKFLKKEIRLIKARILKLNEDRSVLNKESVDEQVASLEKRLAKLENIKIKITEEKQKQKLDKEN